MDNFSRLGEVGATSETFLIKPWPVTGDEANPLDDMFIPAFCVVVVVLIEIETAFWEELRDASCNEHCVVEKPQHLRGNLHMGIDFYFLVFC